MSRRPRPSALAIPLLGALALASAAAAQTAPPKEVTMAVSFGPEIVSTSGDGAARLGMACAVTEYPSRSDPRYTLREPYLIAEIDADADAFVFYGARETRRLRAVFETEAGRMRWSPQELDRLRPPAQGELDIDAVLDLPRTARTRGAGARRRRSSSPTSCAGRPRSASPSPIPTRRAGASPSPSRARRCRPGPRPPTT